MYKPRDLSPATMQWVMRQALNELNAYLCETDFHEQNGKDWHADASAIAVQCRAIAASATRAPEKAEWLGLAKQYEDTI